MTCDKKFYAKFHQYLNLNGRESLRGGLKGGDEEVYVLWEGDRGFYGFHDMRIFPDLYESFYFCLPKGQ